jgi:hypothetical protein
MSVSALLTRCAAPQLRWAILGGIRAETDLAAQLVLCRLFVPFGARLRLALVLSGNGRRLS